VFDEVSYLARIGDQYVDDDNPFKVCNNCSSVERLDEFFLDSRMRVLVEHLAPVIIEEGNNTCSSRQHNRPDARPIIHTPERIQ
jgi:hypothetical protein